MRASGRVIIVLAVLLGLFGMHGLASGQTGCHSPTVPMPASHSAAHSTTLSTVPAAAPAMSMTASCVFVQPTGWPGHPTVPVLAIVALTVLAIGSLLFERPRPDRAPRSGVPLLRCVCVSRT